MANPENRVGGLSALKIYYKGTVSKMGQYGIV
jgi:hypothetical protein